VKTLIEQLAKECDIGQDYIDAWGQSANISIDSQAKSLTAMGYDLSNEQRLLSQLENEAVIAWQQTLDPVYIFTQQQGISITLRCAIGDAALKHSFRIQTEQGDKHVHHFIPVDGQLLATQVVDGVEWHQYQHMLPESVAHTLPLGYHQISCYLSRKKQGEAQLIVAPERCYIPKEMVNGTKHWGFSIQLYCLRSSRNWGVGDFTDLQELSSHAAKLGANFIGLNPVERLEGFDSAFVQNWIRENNVLSRAAQLREGEWIDYKAVAELKLSALRVLFDEFDKTQVAKQTSLAKQFEAFIERGAESLFNLAVFEALQVHLKAEAKAYGAWDDFPDEYKSADFPAVKSFARKHKKLVRFHMYLQWQADIQINKASEYAKKAGMALGVYRDLAVGVSEGSAEVWGNQALYCADMSIGAPPDVLGPIGQKWGLPPMNPIVLREQAYAPIVELFRANMNGAGALRIDHVMALMRLWWVHKNDEATHGAYIHYPFDDLLAILALESHRHQCLVVGEDLGTVKEDIRNKLKAKGVLSYRVFFFEQSSDGGFYSPAHYPEQSMAALTTHDMPTLKGYWHCDDLRLGQELGIYSDEALLKHLFASRHEQKQRLLDSLHGHGAIDANISRDVNYVGMTKMLNHAMQCHMAKGNSALLSLQLEDWLEMDKPVNIPGTHKEYPNWQRKLSMNIEDVFARPDLQALGTALSNARAIASKDAKENHEY